MIVIMLLTLAHVSCEQYMHTTRLSQLHVTMFHNLVNMLKLILIIIEQKYIGFKNCRPLWIGHGPMEHAPMKACSYTSLS